MQIEIIIRYQYTPILNGLNNVKRNLKYQVMVRMQSTWKSHLLLVRMEHGTASLEKNLGDTQ